MKLHARQHGIGMLGMISLLVLIGFLATIGLKLFPVYLESFKVDAALKGVLEDPNVAERSKAEIYEAIARRFDIDDVKSVSYNDIRQKVKIKRENQKVTLTLDYERAQPLFYNLTILAKFNKVVSNQ